MCPNILRAYNEAFCVSSPPELVERLYLLFGERSTNAENIWFFPPYYWDFMGFPIYIGNCNESSWIILMIETASLSRLSQERPQHMPRFEASTTWKSLSPQLFSHQQRIHCGHPSRWKRPRQRAQLVAAADLFQSHQDIKKRNEQA